MIKKSENKPSLSFKHLSKVISVLKTDTHNRYNKKKINFKQRPSIFTIHNRSKEK